MNFRSIFAPGLAAALILAGVVGIAHAAEPTSQTVTVGARHNMPATLYTPDGPGPFPAILVLHTSFGIEQADREFGAKLARAGFIALVPAFLSAHGIRSETRKLAFTSDAQPIYDDLVHVLGEMKQLPKARGDALGVVGFSNGGYFSAWLAATHQVKAGIGYYGAYTGARSDVSQNRFTETFTSASAPFLILHGQNDSEVGIAAAQHLDRILRAAHAPHQFVVYPDTDHVFERNFQRAGNKAAADDAWTRTLAFFNEYVK